MKETGIWSKWSNIILLSDQSLRQMHHSFKTDSFGGREGLFCMQDIFCVPCFFLKLQDDLSKTNSITLYEFTSLCKI